LRGPSLAQPADIRVLVRYILLPFSQGGLPLVPHEAIAGFPAAFFFSPGLLCLFFRAKGTRFFALSPFCGDFRDELLKMTRHDDYQYL
jgi:hypothetical protein